MNAITPAPLPTGLAQSETRSLPDGQPGMPAAEGFGQLLAAMLAGQGNAASPPAPEGQRESGQIEGTAAVGLTRSLPTPPPPSVGPGPSVAPLARRLASPAPLPAASRQEITQESRAPDFAPRIGSHSGEFERARLLVETAFDRSPTPQAPASPEVAQAAGSGPIPPPQVAPHPAGALPEPVQSRNAAPPAAILAGAPAAALRAGSMPAAEMPFSPQPADAGTGGAHPPAPAPGNSPSPAPARATPAPHALATIDFPASEPTHPGAAEAPSAPREGAPGRALPLAAHLLAIDGGVRLLLRMPRLGESERSELEAALARMLEAFGHRRHEIVIHETSKG